MRCLLNCKDLGADVIEIPFIEIRPPRSYRALDSALKKISEYDWLILTSVNGVEALAARMKELGIQTEKLSHLKVATIGPSTRSAAEEMGLKVSVVPPSMLPNRWLIVCGRRFEGSGSCWCVRRWRAM